MRQLTISFRNDMIFHVVLTNFGAVVQLGVRYAGSVEVGGSNPPGSIMKLVLIQISCLDKQIVELSRYFHIGSNWIKSYSSENFLEYIIAFNNKGKVN